MDFVTSEELPLLSGTDIRRLADLLDLRPTKTLGQNYVIDPNTIRRIVNAAHLESTEHVLEIGPGLGSLTLGLLDRAQAVTAVEIDIPVAEHLPTTIEQWRPDSADRLAVISADAMKLTGDDIVAAAPAAAPAPAAEVEEGLLRVAALYDISTMNDSYQHCALQTIYDLHRLLFQYKNQNNSFSYCKPGGFLRLK